LRADVDEYILTSIDLSTDTGSSDTWVAEKGFQCYTLTDKPRKERYCDFGSSGYNASSSSTYWPYPGYNFNITYADNEFLTGSVGFETITVGGLTVKNQEFGLVNAAAWEGDGVNVSINSIIIKPKSFFSNIYI
jgi:hypothetical protein